MPEPSAFEVEKAIEKLKRHKSPGTDQIPAELNKAGRRKIRCEIHKLANSIWITEGVPEEWKESIIVPIIGMAIKQAVVTIQAYQFVNNVQNFIHTASC